MLNVLDPAIHTNMHPRVWERAVRARFHFSEAETNCDRWYRTQKSSYTPIGEKRIDILEDKREEYFIQQDKLHAALASLVEYYQSRMSSFDLGQ